MYTDIFPTGRPATPSMLDEQMARADFVRFASFASASTLAEVAICAGESLNLGLGEPGGWVPSGLFRFGVEEVRHPARARHPDFP